MKISSARCTFAGFVGVGRKELNLMFITEVAVGGVDVGLDAMT